LRRTLEAVFRPQALEAQPLQNRVAAVAESFGVEAAFENVLVEEGKALAQAVAVEEGLVGRAREVEAPAPIVVDV